MTIHLRYRAGRTDGQLTMAIPRFALCVSHCQNHACAEMHQKQTFYLATMTSRAYSYQSSDK